MLYAPTEDLQDKPIADRTTDELKAESARLLLEILAYDTLPYDVELPDEFYVGRASLQDRRFEVECELSRRERFGYSQPRKSEPPLPPLDF